MVAQTKLFQGYKSPDKESGGISVSIEQIFYMSIRFCFYLEY